MDFIVISFIFVEWSARMLKVAVLQMFFFHENTTSDATTVQSTGITTNHQKRRLSREDRIIEVQGESVGTL